MTLIEDLTKSSNLPMLENQVIEDIVLVMWRIYKPRMIKKLVIPHIIHWLIFCFHFTFLFEWSEKEQKDGTNFGPYWISTMALTGLLLLTEIYWIYVMIRISRIFEEPRKLPMFFSDMFNIIGLFRIVFGCVSLILILA